LVWPLEAYDKENSFTSVRTMGLLVVSVRQSDKKKENQHEKKKRLAREASAQSSAVTRRPITRRPIRTVGTPDEKADWIPKSGSTHSETKDKVHPKIGNAMVEKYVSLTTFPSPNGFWTS